MILKIAWRNIWRNHVRSIIIMVAVAIGIWAGISITAFYNGMIEQRIRSAIDTEISHIQIHHPEFASDYDQKFFIPGASGLLQKLKELQTVKEATGRVIIKGMASSASGSAGVTINGVMPAEEKVITGLAAKIKKGAYFNADGKNQILISEHLLDKLRLKLNGRMVLTFTDSAGNIASAAFRICGVYQTINKPYDEVNVFITSAEAGQLTEVKGQVNEIALLLRSNKPVKRLADSLKAALPALQVKTWQEISPEMELLVSSLDSMIMIYMVIILMALAFGIINTMLMSVLERTRELGMLMSLGMNRLKVFRMIVTETFFLVMTGCPAGVLAAIMTISLTARKGINLEFFSDAASSFGYNSLVFPSVTLRQMVLMFLLVVITALLAAMFPATRVLKLKPAEAIRK